MVCIGSLVLGVALRNGPVLSPHCGEGAETWELLPLASFKVVSCAVSR